MLTPNNILWTNDDFTLIDLDEFYQLHRNDASEGNGVEIWLPSEPTENETKLAESILTKLSDTSISRNRGIKEGTAGNSNTDYYVNSHTKCDSMVIELGFVSSTLDNTLFEQNYLDYAKKISEAILENVYLMYDKDNK